MIIGLGFKARTGKGEVASWLVRRHGFIEVAFADALKRACVEIFGLTESQVYGDQKDRLDPFWNDTPRNILQKVGTECLRRGYRDDVWIKALEREVRDPASPETVDADWVVSDCRFPNECEAIHEWGGKLVRIERPDAPSIATGQHASETALERWCGWDYQLINNLTLDDLHAKVDIMLEVLRRNPADDDLSLKGPAGSWRPIQIGDAAWPPSPVFASLGKKTCAANAMCSDCGYMGMPCKCGVPTYLRKPEPPAEAERTLDLPRKIRCNLCGDERCVRHDPPGMGCLAHCRGRYEEVPP